jgi:hypothetical protein
VEGQGQGQMAGTRWERDNPNGALKRRDLLLAAAGCSRSHASMQMGGVGICCWLPVACTVAAALSGWQAV